MKNNITTIAIGVIVIFIVSKIGVFDALLMFILVGAIPGTDYSLPSSFMLLLSLTAMWFLLFRWAALKTISRRATKKLARSAAAHKKRLPKRRFGEV